MDTGCNISTNENLKFHALTHVQKKRLDSVIEMFPNYERDGLGKTRVISHAISPGIGKIILFPYPTSKESWVDYLQLAS